MLEGGLGEGSSIPEGERPRCAPRDSGRGSFWGIWSHLSDSHRWSEKCRSLPPLSRSHPLISGKNIVTRLMKYDFAGPPKAVALNSSYILPFPRARSKFQHLCQTN